MKVTYIKNLNQSFMVVKDAEFEYENFELLMLLNNKIPGLLEVQIIIGDGKIKGKKRDKKIIFLDKGEKISSIL